MFHTDECGDDVMHALQETGQVLGGGVVGGGDLRKTELVEVVEGRGRVIVTWKQSGLCHMVWFARLIRKP